ncbi:MAG: NDP-sugar synthase [Dehalococcoidia bacterium]|nr:NDP-sugar synthase [Dehalococcoidia bacterium]
MKAIILVGGEGTRLRPLTYSVVKPMVPVANRPFIEHVICKLALHGIDEIVLAMGYKPDSIYAYFKDGEGLDVKLTYSLEEKPLGTAGAIKNASGHIKESVFVLNGDCFSDLDYSDMHRQHLRNKAKATIALTHVEDPTRFGVVETDESGRVLRFIEKPKWEDVTSHWINAGVYILEPDVLDYIPDNQFYMFENGVFPRLLENGAPFYAYHNRAYWIDMGTPEQYHRINSDLLLGNCSSPLHAARDLIISEGCEVHPSASLTGPVMLAEGCSVGAGARITGPAVIGRGCRIAGGAVIENSLLWEDITVAEDAIIINSIIASGAKINKGQRLQGQTINHKAPTT